MAKSFLKFIPALTFWGVFSFIIFKIDYPKSLTQATLFQLTVFFIPLFLALSFTINLFFKFLLFSFSISLGIIILLILKALDSLSIISTLLTTIAIFLLLSYFKQLEKKRNNIKTKIAKRIVF